MNLPLNAIFGLSIDTVFESNETSELCGFSAGVSAIQEGSRCSSLSFLLDFLASDNLLLRDCRSMHLFSQYGRRPSCVQCPGINHKENKPTLTRTELKDQQGSQQENKGIARG